MITVRTATVAQAEESHDNINQTYMLETWHTHSSQHDRTTTHDENPSERSAVSVRKTNRVTGLRWMQKLPSSWCSGMHDMTHTRGKSQDGTRTCNVMNDAMERGALSEPLAYAPGTLVALTSGQRCGRRCG